MRFNTVLNSFQYGEVSPRFLSRTDTDQYQKGVQKLENMIVLPSGGAVRRPGSVYVGYARYQTSAVSACHRLIPFIFSKTEANDIWLVGTGNQLYLYAYRPKGVLDAEPVNTTRTPAYIDPYFAPEGYLTSLDFGSHVTLTQTIMDEMQFVQSGDLLFISHESFPTIVITRTAADTFTFKYLETSNPAATTASYTLNRAYRDANVTATQLKVDNLAVGTRTMTASAAFFDAEMAYGTTDGAGRTWLKVTNSGTTGVCYVTAVGSSTSATVEVVIAFGATNTYSDDWEESAWSFYRGFPGAVGLFESRLILGGNDSEPDRVWGSQVYDLLHFMQTRLSQDSATDASGLGYFGSTSELDPFSFSPTAREVNRIGWIQSGRTLAVGTLGQEFVATGGSTRVLSSSSVSFTDQTTVGSAAVQAIRINKSTVFVSRDKKRLYQYAYDNDSQSYVADNITALAEHIVDQTRLDAEEELDADPITNPEADDYISYYGFKYLLWHSSRQVLWGITTTGDLVGLTWDPQVKCLAWHRHILGGFNNGEKTVRPKILSAAVIPSESGGTDTLHLLVERVVDGYTTISLEVIGADYSPHRLDYSTQDFEVGEAPVFMDSAIEKVLSPASTTVTGLEHLAGETVDVLADGFYHPQCFVDALTGEIELNREAEFVIVGLPYTPRIKFNPTEPSHPLGSAFGLTGRIEDMTIRFYRTIRALVSGPEETEVVGFRPGSLGMNDPLPLFTGDKRVNVRMGPETRMELEITQDQPFPMTILGVAVKGNMNE